MTWLVTRPYITAFLVAFVVLASRRMGWQRTLGWLCSGYAIALISEASSIRIGIPYGLYTYRYDQLVSDPLIFGVPVWDSLSYPFLIYAGWSQAHWRDRLGPPWRVALLGALFTMLLDMMIDPVARLGDRWFLGQIYEYAHPGRYFGVPASNFIGWFLVPWLVITANQALWRLPVPVFQRLRPIAPPSRLDLGFYLSIALFNIAIAFAIGAWPIGLCSSMILTGIILGTAPGLQRHEIAGERRGNSGHCEMRR